MQLGLGDARHEKPRVRACLVLLASAVVLLSISTLMALLMECSGSLLPGMQSGGGSQQQRQLLLQQAASLEIALQSGDRSSSSGGGSSSSGGDASGDASGGQIQAGSEPPPQGDDEAYVAVCITAKDEHCDIREWVLYHASIGVGKFYVFDTESEQPMQPVLEDLIASGLVQYHYVTNTSAELGLAQPRDASRAVDWQRPVYMYCVRQFGERHRWMGFFDVDEFVILNGFPDGKPAPASLPDLLARHESDAGLGLHWRLFSSSGHMERPAGGILASYTACWKPHMGVHLHVKSFVQPALVEGIKTPHSFAYKEGHGAVNTAGQALTGPMLKGGQVTYQGALLHHYISRSLVDFALKMQNGGGGGQFKTLDHFIKYERGSSRTCTQAVPLGQALRARFDLNRNVPERCMGPPAAAEATASAGAATAAR